MNVYFRFVCLVIGLSGWITGAAAATETDQIAYLVPAHESIHEYPNTLYIAQSDTQSNQDIKPKSGTLIMPADYEQKETSKEKTCIRVCSDWGETCVYDINKGRKCRRTCKATAMECFEQ